MPSQKRTRSAKKNEESAQGQPSAQQGGENPSPIAPGTRVRATYKGSEKVYAATVEASNPDGTYQVMYDDGDYDGKTPRSAIQSVEGPGVPPQVPTPVDRSRAAAPRSRAAVVPSSSKALPSTTGARLVPLDQLEALSTEARMALATLNFGALPISDKGCATHTANNNGSEAVAVVGNMCEFALTHTSASGRTAGRGPGPRHSVFLFGLDEKSATPGYVELALAEGRVLVKIVPGQSMTVSKEAQGGSLEQNTVALATHPVLGQVGLEGLVVGVALYQPMSSIAIA